MTTRRRCTASALRSADPPGSRGRHVPGPPLLVLDEIDVLEALIRSDLPDGRAAVAALLCDPAGFLLGIVHCVGSAPDTASLIAARLVDAVERIGEACGLASVWFAVARGDGEPLELSAPERVDLDRAGDVLAGAGVDVGSVVVVGPHGWAPG